MIIRITKEGSAICFYTEEKENPIKFDCKDLVLISFTGRVVKTMPSIGKYNGGGAMEKVVNAVNGYLKERRNGYGWTAREEQRIRKYEPFIPYLDLVDNFPDNCPKGYIKWVLDNNERFSPVTLAQFETLERMKNFSSKDKETLNSLTDHFGERSSVITTLMSLTNEEILAFLKMFRITIKSFSWSVEREIDDFLESTKQQTWRKHFPSNWIEYVDTNRSLAYNTKNIMSLVDKIRAEKILTNENKIRPIISLSNDEFVIVVPENMEQFTDEGRQQHNCVGHYYHDSIAEGKNIVYFIRKADSPEKSFTTCRYNVQSKQTVEHRLINNVWQDDEIVFNFIQEIDKMINTLLNE